MGRRLNVFAGFSRQQLRRRVLALLAAAAVAGAVVYLFPVHARTFLDRLLLGATHYPSATVIDQVLVNHRIVLPGRGAGLRRPTCAVPRGSPSTSWSAAAARLPEQGTVQLRSASGQARPVLLEMVTAAERQQRLRDAALRIRQAVANRNVDLTGPWAEEIATLARCDAAPAAELVDAAKGDTNQLLEAARALEAAAAALPGSAEETVVLRGQLPQLVDSLTYQLYLGDAWTDSARIDMIPLPVVELQMTTSPPRYVKNADTGPLEPNARQISVLEGSRVQVALECTNGKELRDAWLTITSDDQRPRYELAPPDGQPNRWTLTTPDTPFARVKSEVRFEVQVTDTDGLHLDAPLRGYIRLKADRPPSCLAELVHRVVLPTAKPRLSTGSTTTTGFPNCSCICRSSGTRIENGSTRRMNGRPCPCSRVGPARAGESAAGRGVCAGSGPAAGD